MADKLEHTGTLMENLENLEQHLVEVEYMLNASIEVDNLKQRLTDLEGSLDAGIDAYKQTLVRINDINQRVTELEEHFAKWRIKYLNNLEEVRNRLDRLEERSFIGSLCELMIVSQEKGIDPMKVCKEALEKLEKALD